MKKLLLTGIALGAVLAFSGMANAQIKLGVAGPITGPNAAFGAQLKNGVEQAVEDINAKGGIIGQKISVSVGDDVSIPSRACRSPTSSSATASSSWSATSTPASPTRLPTSTRKTAS